MIDDDDLDLTPIIAIDGARRIENRHAVAQGQTAPGTHLDFTATGDLKEDARPDETALAGKDQTGLRRRQIGSGRLGRGIRRRRQFLGRLRAAHFDEDLIQETTPEGADRRRNGLDLRRDGDDHRHDWGDPRHAAEQVDRRRRQTSPQ